MKNTLIARASELGKNAVANGIKAPYQCSETMAMLEGRQVGDKEGMAILKAWSSAFDIAMANKIFSKI